MSASKSDSRPGVSASRFDPRPGVGSNEKTYLGKSPKKACVRLLVLAAVAAGVAGAFAASIEFRTWLRVERRRLTSALRHAFGIRSAWSSSEHP